MAKPTKLRQVRKAAILLTLMCTLAGCTSSWDTSSSRAESSRAPATSSAAAKPAPMIEGAVAVDTSPLQKEGWLIQGGQYRRHTRIYLFCAQENRQKGYIYDLAAHTFTPLSLPIDADGYASDGLPRLNDGRFAILCETDAVVCIVLKNDLSVETVIPRPKESVGWGFVLSPDGKSIAYSANDGLHVADSAFQNDRLLLKRPVNTSSDVTNEKTYNCCGFTPDGKRILYTLDGYE